VIIIKPISAPATVPIMRIAVKLKVTESVVVRHKSLLKPSSPLLGQVLGL